MWDEVESCRTIANGIYEVTTAGHGGVMIAAELAPKILSPEALKKGVRDGGYYCYEEDCDAAIPLRELWDKGILTQAHEYFTHYYVNSERPEAENGCVTFVKATETEKAEYFKWWNNAINESLEEWSGEYWKAHEQAEIHEDDPSGENTDLTKVLDQSELGGAKARFKGNFAAIRLVNKLYSENRNPTEAERKVLSQFVGWGGLSQAFDENNKQWRREYTELKGLLSQEDYEQARGSTLNAYYTAKDVLGGIYSALNRFGVKGNNRILEPSMGTGNFFGFMPKEIADGSRLYGVELDNLTGRIAAKLYPQANVQIKGFEDTSFPNDKFDIAVGNVPFGGYGVADSDYNRYNFRVHDYFLAKSIDKVKPNGIVAIVTSKGTMDKLNPSARKYVAERAELLGAIRLPNTAFKQTAGTEAVADILFFRKREEKLTDLSGVEWLGTGKTEEGYEINQYFVNHPEMVLGTLAEEIGLYGGNDITVKPDGRELSEAIAEALNNLPKDFYSVPEIRPEAETTIEVDYNVKPMCYKSENGRLYMRIGDEMQEQRIPSFPKDAYQRICGMIALREELHHILDLQIQGCSDEVLEREQHTLNAQYDLFVKRYGELNGQTNTRLFSEDGDSALLLACENIDKETGNISKSDIFFKRTIRPYVMPTSTDDCFEALQISKNERGRVDISYIEELTGKSYDDVLFELGDAVFRNPETVDRTDKYSGFETSEEYLSGKVVAKLNTARRYAEQYPEYHSNVEALEKVQPTPLTASEISVRLGQTWIDKEIYKQFYIELVGVNWWRRGDVELFYNPHDSSWRLDQKDSVRLATQMKQKEVYGTARAPAYRLFIDCMNLKATTIYDTVQDADGKERRVLNQAETIAAREKQNKIREEFANWIFAKPERREELEATYNRLFNQIRLPSYDGSQDNYEVCYYSFNFSIDLTAPSYELRTNNSQLTNGMQTNESFEYHAWGDDFQRLYYKSPSANIYSSTTETFFFVEACESNTGIWSFYAIDVVGNKSETVTVYLDCKPPQISLANKMKFGTTVGDDIIVSAFDDIGPAKLYIKFESEEWFSSENNYTISKTERNGKYYFYAEDGNGNRTDINWIILSTEDPVGNLIKSDTDNSRYFFWNNEYWSATLDGEVYLEGTLISNEGQHEIILSNNAFKTKSYSFVIEHCYKIVEKREATCFENGIVRYECSQCKNSYEEVDYTSGHNYIISTIPPTCTEYENITYTCNLCGKKYEKKGNYPTGHSYLETVTVEPTCIKDGERKSKCEFCGVEYLTKIAASGHTYKITDTSTQDGKTTRTYTCMKCGDNYKQELGNQYDEVFDYVEYLFEQYCPYMLWVLLASSGIWSIVIGVMIAIAHKNEEKEKAKKMLINFVIGLVVIAVIVVACPYLIRGIAALVT